MSTRTDKNPSLPLNHDSTRNVDQEILRAVHDLAFGSVEVVIHDNRVTEIKQVRRTRFESRKND